MNVLLNNFVRTSFFNCSLAALTAGVVLCTGCQTFTDSNHSALLSPASEYGATWYSPQSEYQSVRHVEPQRVASREVEKTRVERLDDVIAKVIGTGNQAVKARATFVEAETIYNEAVRVRQSAGQNPQLLMQAGELFVKAGNRYEAAAGYWEDSALEEDAVFMASECYFYIDYYARVSELYRSLLKKYKHTRHLAGVQRKRFAIAQYWLKADEDSPRGFFSLNFNNESMPFNSRFDKAIAILNSIREDDPTSEIADDATMLMAQSYFRLDKLQKAHEVLTDLVKLFPSSEHQFVAHTMLLQTKISLYRGPQYSGIYLDEGEKLVRAIRRQFPEQAEKESPRWDKFSKQIRYLQAEREWWVAKFYEKKNEIGAARIYYRQITNEFHDTPFANRAFARLNDLQHLPAKPDQPLEWLVNLFPEDDPVKPLIATKSDGMMR